MNLPRRLRPGEEATLYEHLGELRGRLIVCLVSIALGFIVAFVFHDHLVRSLEHALPANRRHLVTFGVTEPFMTSLWVSLWAGFALALPIVLWQMWSFLAPALQEHTQRTVTVFVFCATALLACGLAFGYYLALPASVHFLTNYDSNHFDIVVRAKDYYAFTSFLLLGVALSFEVPVFVLGLVRLRILSAARLRGSWRFGIFAMTALGVLLPGVDPVSTTLSVVTLNLLYGLAIGLASFFEPRWRATSTAEAATDV